MSQVRALVFLSAGVLAVLAGIVAWSPATAEPVPYLLDFEGVPVGYTGGSFAVGSGISGPDHDGVITASGGTITFDANCDGGCTGGDTDLFAAGQGNILVISDGDLNDPGDSASGGIITFDFGGFAPVNLVSIAMIDLEAGSAATVSTFGTGGEIGSAIPFTTGGDGSSGVLALGRDGVTQLVVELAGSGGVLSVAFEAEPGPSPPPAITSIAPTSGPQGGGTEVTITGSDFSGATSVTFGGVPASSFAVDSDVQVSAVAPPGSGTVNVVVTTAAGTSADSAGDDFTYVPQPPGPMVTSIAPSNGSEAGGTVVTISGANLSGALAVHFGAAPAAFTVEDDHTIIATSPAGVGVVSVRVTTPDGTSPDTAADNFTYLHVDTLLPLLTIHLATDDGETRSFRVTDGLLPRERIVTLEPGAQVQLTLFIAAPWSVEGIDQAVVLDFDGCSGDDATFGDAFVCTVTGDPIQPSVANLQLAPAGSGTIFVGETFSVVATFEVSSDLSGNALGLAVTFEDLLLAFLGASVPGCTLVPNQPDASTSLVLCDSGIGAMGINGDPDLISREIGLTFEATRATGAGGTTLSAQGSAGDLTVGPATTTLTIEETIVDAPPPPSPTLTPVPTATPSFTPTPSPTPTSTPTATSTPTPTSTPSVTPESLEPSLSASGAAGGRALDNLGALVLGEVFVIEINFELPPLSPGETRADSIVAVFEYPPNLVAPDPSSLNGCLELGPSLIGCVIPPEAEGEVRQSIGFTPLASADEAELAAWLEVNGDPTRKVVVTLPRIVDEDAASGRLRANVPTLRPGERDKMRVCVALDTTLAQHPELLASECGGDPIVLSIDPLQAEALQADLAAAAAAAAERGEPTGTVPTKEELLARDDPYTVPVVLTEVMAVRATSTEEEAFTVEVDEANHSQIQRVVGGEDVVVWEFTIDVSETARPGDYSIAIELLTCQTGISNAELDRHCRPLDDDGIPLIIGTATVGPPIVQIAAAVFGVGALAVGALGWWLGWFAVLFGPPKGPGIFISYRRSDLQDLAGRIRDRLVQEFGAKRVFMDVESMGAGEDFVDSIEQTLAACGVFIALIGDRWRGPGQPDGVDRIMQDDDWIRREVGKALARGDVVVMPVLVNGMPMPGVDELPPELATLPRRNAFAMRTDLFERDVESLIRDLHDAFARAAAEAEAAAGS